jgi:GTP-binding protein LepA
VVYEVLLHRRQVLRSTPVEAARPGAIEEIREPIITAHPGAAGLRRPVITLCSEKRGVQKNMQYLGHAGLLTYELPLAEVVLDFFDKLKSVSRGYASLDYEFSHLQAAPLVKLDILINGEPVDALSIIVHRDRA